MVMYGVPWYSSLISGCYDCPSSSDHRPVFATFDVGIDTQFVPEKNIADRNVFIVFEEITAEVNNRGGK